MASQGKWLLCVQLNTARKTKFMSLHSNRYKKHLQSLQFPSFPKHPKVYVPVKCVKNLFYLLRLHISRDPAGDAWWDVMLCTKCDTAYYRRNWHCTFSGELCFYSVLFTLILKRILHSLKLKPVLLFTSHRASMNAPGTKQLFLRIKTVFKEALMLYAGSLMLGPPLGTGSHWALWPPKTLDAKVRAW